MSTFFLADDLSGALDAAGAFHRAGQSVAIALSLDVWPPPRPGQIVGLTTETRNCGPAEAAAVVQRAIAEGHARGARLVYKKIDSTLRGPVAAELAALEQALPDARILFTSANPAVGRTVRGGVLLVNGVPVAETEFARDPVSPVRESSVAKLLGPAATTRVEIADALTEADLEAAVVRTARRGAPWVAVGSGALARPVAQWLADHSRASTDAVVPRPASPPRAVAGARGCLLLCGSAHPRNREQAAVLSRERGVEIRELRLDHAAAMPRSVAAALGATPAIAVTIEQKRGDSARVVRALADIAVAAVADAGVRRLFVTGGETAFAVCRELGMVALEFEREIESGLCVACGKARSAGIVRLAIKPGGFGDQNTWMRAYDTLGS